MRRRGAIRWCFRPAVLTILLVGGCGDRPAEAPERTGSEPSGSALDPNPEGEVLIATPPRGWQETAALETPVLRMAEYGPEGEPEGRLERLTFEAQSTKPLPDPITFVRGVGRDLATRCEHAEDLNISSGHENGYPTSVRLMICPRFADSPHGQVVMTKAIRGNERFYVITRRLRVPPITEQAPPLDAQQMAAWTTHLKAVQVCDTRDPEHPCPASIAGDAAGP